LGAALQADGENEVRGDGLKHQKEKRSMDHFSGLDVSVKETSICIVFGTVALGFELGDGAFVCYRRMKARPGGPRHPAEPGTAL
jgi:hypothetical protein